MRAEIDKLSTPEAPFGSSMARAYGNWRIATFHVIPERRQRPRNDCSPLDLREIRDRAGCLADLIEELEPIFA